MQRIERSITIDAPVEKVAERLHDPTTAPEMYPYVMEVKDIQGEGVGKHWKTVVKLFGLSFESEAKIVEHVRNERQVVRVEGGVTCTEILSFERHNGGTKVNLVLEGTVPVPVLNKLAEPVVMTLIDRQLDLAVENLKVLVEAEV